MICRLTKFPERRWLSNFGIFDSTDKPVAVDCISAADSIEGLFSEVSADSLLELHKMDQLLAKSLFLRPPKFSSTATFNAELMESYRWFAVAEDVASSTLSVYPIQGIHDDVHC